MNRTTLGTAILAALLLAAAMPGCDKPPTVDRAGRLLLLAGEEAANIANTQDRFTRQLNIADTLLRTGRKPDAARTLALARDTLNTSKQEEFDDFHRIAGWTAVSQLARTAGDRTLAIKASDKALAALNDVQPVANRADYVMSLAGELENLRGKSEAIELLNSGGAWAKEIPNPAARRLALTSFAERLVNLDAFEVARSTLRQDPDAAWRTDTFVALSGVVARMQEAEFAAHRRQGGAGGRGASAPMAATPMAGPVNPELNSLQANFGQINNYGRDVRFERVYQQQGGR